MASAPGGGDRGVHGRSFTTKPEAAMILERANIRCRCASASASSVGVSPMYLSARLETEAGKNIGDALFGFRIYPLDALLAVMTSSRYMRRYDFDTEAVVRLAWRGVKIINRPAPVRYFSTAQGGVSHFRYGRDNLRLAAMHLRLVAAALFRVRSF